VPSVIIATGLFDQRQFRPEAELALRCPQRLGRHCLADAIVRTDGNVTFHSNFNLIEYMFILNILKREKNNFEILRLIAASAVIVGRSRPITGDKKSRDLVLSILHFDYSGSLAVKFFFLLSGLVVTNSLLTNSDLRRFLVARVARIFPALVIVLIISTYIIGPLLTSDPIYTYLSDHATVKYIYNNIILRTEFVLPGVFTDTPQKSVNGAIWTIPMEFFCYVILAILGAVGLSKNRLIFSLIAVVLGSTVLIKPEVLALFGLPMEYYQMMVFFAIGTLIAIWKDKVLINLEVMAALLIATYVFRHTPAFSYIVCTTIFSVAIWISTLPIVLNFRLPGDYSYGTYLAGWPIQQLVYVAFPHMGAVSNWVISLPIAIAFGAVSWHVIEKPAMKFGKKLGGRSRS
jgi:peptidoglycan/LPS O-acetylase OafA/YrhL